MCSQNIEVPAVNKIFYIYLVSLWVLWTDLSCDSVSSAFGVFWLLWHSILYIPHGPVSGSPSLGLAINDYFIYSLTQVRSQVSESECAFVPCAHCSPLWRSFIWFIRVYT